MKISHRLIALSSCGAVALVAVGAIGLYGVRTIQQEVTTLIDVKAPLQNAMLSLQGGEERLMSALLELSHADDAAAVQAIDADIERQLDALAPIAERIRQLDAQASGESTGFEVARRSIRELVSARLNALDHISGMARTQRAALADLDTGFEQIRKLVSLADDSGQPAMAANVIERRARLQRAALEIKALLSELGTVIYATGAQTNRFRLSPLQVRSSAAIDRIDDRLQVLRAIDPAGVDSAAPAAAGLPESAALRAVFLDEQQGLFPLRLAVLDTGTGAKLPYLQARRQALALIDTGQVALDDLLAALEAGSAAQADASVADADTGSLPADAVSVSQSLVLQARRLQTQFERLLSAASKQQVDTAGQAVMTTIDQLSALLAELASSIGASAPADLQTAVKALIDQLPPQRAALVEVVDAAGTMLESETQLDERLAVLQQMRASERAATLARLGAVSRNSSAVADSISQRVDLATVWILCLSATGVLLLAFVSLITIRFIGSRLRRALAVAEAVSRGHLDPVVVSNARDEIALVTDAMRQMVATLDGSVRKIRTATGHVTTGAEAISRGNCELSSRTDQQAEQLSVAAGTTSRIGEIARQSAQAARQASALSQTASEAAGSGRQVVSNAMQSMRHIEEGAREINSITTVIDAIAFQTNMLALNAAVEAGRAGESGRGFAVVASEVGKLARKSKESVLQIREIIDANVRHVESGSQLVSEAASRMEEVVSRVDEVAALIGEVAASSQGQVDEIERVDGSVSSLERMTQQNAALSQKTTSAARGLLEQSRTLDEPVSVFRLPER